MTPIYRKKHDKAFTLVEALVAVSVLSVAITGPLLIAQKGIDSAVYSKDEITSYYLAEEAVEYIRNARDTNRIASNPWLNGLGSCIVASGGEACTIDARITNFMSAGAVTSCPSGVCPAISYDPSSGLYGYGSGGTWAATKFTRTISIDNRASPKEAAVSVTVSWNTNLFSPNRSFTVKEYIFNF